MFSKKSKPKEEKPTRDSTALVRQDSRTVVKARYAQSETSNSSVHNSTTIDNNSNRINYQTTRQTLVHSRTAGVAEICTRRTPTQEELNELYNLRTEGLVTRLAAQLNHPTSSNFASPPPLSPTVMKTVTTTAIQKTGQTLTEHHYVSNATRNPLNTDAKPFGANSSNTGAIPKSNTGYQSPYRSTSTGYVFSYPSTSTTSNLSRPQLTTPSLSAIGGSSLAASRNKESNVEAASALVKSPIKPKSRLKPGTVYILNNVKFDNNDSEERKGSDKDVKKLKETFEQYKMKVIVKNDQKLRDIKTIAEKIRITNFESLSCVVIVILSHGSRNDMISAKDGEYNIDEQILYPILENPTLENKPKIFIIQACKGNREVGQLQRDAATAIKPATDVLKLYSTFEGYVSYRHIKNGSIFIQILCEHLRNYGNREGIVTIMNRVMKDVKKEVQQTPAIYTTMTGDPFIFGDYVKNA